MTGELKPKMSDAELTLLSSAITGKTCAIEFGTGGSTLRLVNAGVGRVFSVDSDPVWVTKVAEHEVLRPLVDSGALTVHLADIGPTTDWGFPSDRSKIAQWPNYWGEPWHRVEADQVDLVLVDGRFRVACALNSIMQGNRDLTMVIHDFWNRPEYHLVLKYVNCACRADKLGVFFAKATIDLRAVAAAPSLLSSLS